MLQPDVPLSPHSILVDDRSLPASACICLIGAGGKTTTLLALARRLALSGRSVLVTTTTKMWPPEGLPLVLASKSECVEGEIDEMLPRSPVVALGEGFTDTGKLTGVAPELICSLWQRRAAVVLVEADGAAGRPLKVHGLGEPVVPACATHVILVAGVDALGAPVGPDTVHRLEHFLRTRGEAGGNRISAKDIARSLHDAARFSPSGSGLTFVLNKVEGAEGIAAAQEITDALHEFDGQSRVVWTARGVPVPQMLSGVRE